MQTLPSKGGEISGTILCCRILYWYTVLLYQADWFLDDQGKFDDVAASGKNVEEEEEEGDDDMADDDGADDENS